MRTSSKSRPFSTAPVKVRVALVWRDNENVAELLQRLPSSLGKALAEDSVVHEVLPEIKRRRKP